MNKTNGLELIDFNKNDYYTRKNKNFLFSNFIYINILFSGIIIFIFIFIIFRKCKRKKNKSEIKTNIEISSDIHLNNIKTTNSIINNKNLI